MVHRYLTMTFPCKKNTIYGTPPQLEPVNPPSPSGCPDILMNHQETRFDSTSSLPWLVDACRAVAPNRKQHFQGTFFGVKLCGSCGKTCQNPSSCAISAGKNTFLSAKWACFSWSNPTILWQNPTILPMAAWATPPMTYCSKEIPGDLA